MFLARVTSRRGSAEIAIHGEASNLGKSVTIDDRGLERLTDRAQLDMSP